MNKTNTATLSGTDTTFLKVSTVKVTNNAAATVFDGEAKDFLQDNGFGGLKVDAGNRNYIHAHVSEDALILIELQAPSGPQPKFKLIRVFLDYTKEIECGYVLYRQSEPGPDQTLEINAFGDEVKDWTLICTLASEDEVKRGRMPPGQSSTTAWGEERRSRGSVSTPPSNPTGRPRMSAQPIPPRTNSTPEKRDFSFASPAIRRALEDAAAPLQKAKAASASLLQTLHHPPTSTAVVTPVVASSEAKPASVAQPQVNGVHAAAQEAEVLPVVTTPVARPVESLETNTPHGAEQVTIEPTEKPEQTVRKETAEPMKKPVLRQIVAFVVLKACELTNTDPKNLAKTGRKNRIEAMAKRVIMQILKFQLGLKEALDELAGPLGASGHATLYTIAAKAKADFKEDATFRKVVRAVEAAVRAEFKNELGAGEEGEAIEETPAEVKLPRGPKTKPATTGSEALSLDLIQDSAVFTLAQLGTPPPRIASAFGIEVAQVHEVVGRLGLHLQRENREDIMQAVRKCGAPEPD